MTRWIRNHTDGKQKANPGWKLPDTFGVSLATLMSALSARDSDSSRHSIRVAGYAALLGRRMGMDWQTREAIRQGALLHDVGKIGIADSILYKPGRLTEEEEAEMRRHPEIGYRVLQSAGHGKIVSNIARFHHENFDGSGYPLGLKGDEIPFGAQIVALADSLDAMTSDRPYRPAMPLDAARREIERGAGQRFDPLGVRIFLEVPAEEWRAAARQPHVALWRSSLAMPERQGAPAI